MWVSFPRVCAASVLPESPALDSLSDRDVIDALTEKLLPCCASAASAMLARDQAYRVAISVFTLNRARYRREYGARVLEPAQLLRDLAP